MKNFTYTVISLYKFFEIKKIFNFKNNLIKIFKNVDVKGTILIAPEGININISMHTFEYMNILSELKMFINFENEDLKIFSSENHIFKKFKVKIKKEILTTRRLKSINPLKLVGEYVDAKKWDKLITDTNTILLDMRNEFEINVGTFINSINPKCKDFTSLLNWLEKEFIHIKNIQHKKVAMFCTGGIRCEKASSFLLSLGKNNVYHLQGGILNYLKRNKESNLWIGECFVFDDRVSINKKLKKGTYDICHACRMPLSTKDKSRKEFVEGESCHLCYSLKTEEQRKRYRMRNSIIRLQR